MKVLPIAEACHLITDGTHYTPPDVGVGVPFLTVKDMGKKGLDLKGCSRIDPSEYEAAAKQNSAPRSGDVLFSKDGTVGKVHVVSDEPPFAVLSSIAIIRPNEKILCSKYLAQFLQTPALLSLAERRKTGSALRRIILKDIKQIEIPLPPLDEQRRIAGILDQADALRRLRVRALEKLNTLGQAIFHEMFGEMVVRNPSSDTTHLDALVSVKSGFAFKSEDFASEGLPVIRISNLDGKIVDLTSCARIPQDKLGRGVRFEVFENDLLIAMSGATTGKVGVTPSINGRAFLNQRVGKYEILKPERLTPGFLQFFVQTDQYRDVALSGAWGAAQPNVSGKQLTDMSIHIPDLDRQIEFEGRVKFLENQLIRCSLSATEHETLFTSLQHRAFRGDL